MSQTCNVAGVRIKQDADGRFCLNDLHKASGGEKAKQPANFMRLDTTQAMICELDKSSDVRSFKSTADFEGNQLQELGSHEKALDLIAFFTAPIDEVCHLGDAH